MTSKQPGQAVQNGNVAESPVAAHNEQCSCLFPFPKSRLARRPAAVFEGSQLFMAQMSQTGNVSARALIAINVHLLHVSTDEVEELISMSDILLQSHTMGDTLLSSFENVHPKFS